MMVARPVCVLLLVLCVLACAAPCPALAAGDSVNLTLCKKVLSRMLCKPYGEFGYAGKAEGGVYIITVLYASRNSEYLCAVLGDGEVVVQDRTWHAMRQVFPLRRVGRCLEATVRSRDCPSRSAVRACAPRTRRSARERRRETFWNRPVPKILDEEYKAMTARGQNNSTSPAGQPAPGK